MPIHDWTRVEAGIFHHFHHRWISAISDALNSGLLPEEFYALAEQFASGFGPDVLTLQGNGEGGASTPSVPQSQGGGILLAPPKVQLTAKSEGEFYHRKQKSIAVRHVSGDRIVAMIEVVSPGNKSNRSALRSFIEKAAQMLSRQIHLLILDLHPPSRRDPQGLHAAIWEYFSGQSYSPPPDKSLTLASYECDLEVRAYVVPAAVGDPLTDMPLFLEPGGHVVVPLEATYQSAWQAVPRRWRTVLEGASA